MRPNAILALTGAYLSFTYAIPAVPNAISNPSQVEHSDEAKQLIKELSVDKPKTWLKKLTSFYTRDFRTKSGREASDWLFEQAKQIASASSSITVKQFVHERFDQPSIIAQIPGNSQDLVILGAHLDSTANGGDPNSRAPGADDDGSGVVTVLETLRVLANTGFKPHNTLEFHFYAAEEAGRLGSKAVFRKYKAANKRVLAMVQQDMTGYSPSKTISVLSDYVDEALSKFVKVVVTAYTGKAPTRSACGYDCSDHASATENGFPSAHVTEQDLRSPMNPNNHRPSDTFDTIEWDSVLLHAQFEIGYMVEASYLGRNNSMNSPRRLEGKVPNGARPVA